MLTFGMLYSLRKLDKQRFNKSPGFEGETKLVKLYFVLFGFRNVQVESVELGFLMSFVWLYFLRW